MTSIKTYYITKNVQNTNKMYTSNYIESALNCLPKKEYNGIQIFPQ